MKTEPLNDRRLIILRGLPGSGKSTLAAQLQYEFEKNGFSCNICSTDNYHIENGVYIFKPSKLKEFHQANQETCRQSMIYGVNVIIIDNTNITFEQILPYALLAKENMYKVELLEVKTDLSAEQLAARNKHGVPAHSIAKMLNKYENNESIVLKLKGYGISVLDS